MVSSYLFNSFGLAIIVLTIIVNLLMYPLTQKQLKASKAMQSLQAEIAEVRKKYAKDRQKAAQEQMRLMRQSGVSPAGCLLPILVQMPVWIALYQSILRLLATAPEGFLNLSQRLYTSWSSVFSSVPLENHFLWLDLAAPDLLLAILVGGTQWVQQKMVTPATDDPQQRAQNQMMLWMMPLMFAFMAMSFPSGLALYWVTSTAIRIVLQYFVTGWGGLFPQATGSKVTKDKETKGRETRQEKPSTEAGTVVETSSARKEGLGYGESGDKRQDRRGSHRTSPRAIRRQSGGGRSHRRKGR